MQSTYHFNYKIIYSMYASEKMSTANAFFETLFHGPYLKVRINEGSKKDST